MRNQVGILPALVLFVSLTVTLRGQEAAAPGASAARDEFEVASIKRSVSQDGFVRMAALPNGSVSMTNVTLQALIRTAFRVQEYQLAGVPGWATRERYDIVAKAQGPATPDRLMTMLRALLEDRFKLKVHIETRDVPMYALVLATADGGLGPQLRKASGDCQMPTPGAPPAPTVTAAVPCGMRSVPGSITGRGISLTMLATTLSGTLGRLVNDRTGLTGTFDLDVKWTPMELPPQPLVDPVGKEVDPSDGDGASIFTGLREQLGLRLRTEDGPSEVVVIDSAEPPSEN